MKESTFLKTSYLRSLLFFIPMGVMMIIFGIKEYDKEIDEYSKTKGIIESSHLYWEDTPFNIELENGIWYSTYKRRYFNDLKQKAIKGKKVIIWYEDDTIKKMIINKELVIPYEKGTNFYYILSILLGALIAVGNLYYVLKHVNHIEGKR